MATSLPSQACCSIPPVVGGKYDPKGKYVELSGGRKCYSTGPSDAATAILIVGDIFGYFPQALQGADILALADSKKPHRVFMPDFFGGKPFPLSNFPPDTDEKKKALGDFFKDPASPPDNAALIPGLIEEITASGGTPSITQWAAVGFCWGGKVVALASAASNCPFKVAAMCHPAMVDPADAENIKIPFATLASKDEDPKAVEEFDKNLTGPRLMEIFGDQIHGFMAARADLSQESARKGFEKGYSLVLDFFHRSL